MSTSRVPRLRDRRIERLRRALRASHAAEMRPPAPIRSWTARTRLTARAAEPRHRTPLARLRLWRQPRSPGRLANRQAPPRCRCERAADACGPHAELTEHRTPGSPSTSPRPPPTPCEPTIITASGARRRSSPPGQPATRARRAPRREPGANSIRHNVTGGRLEIDTHTAAGRAVFTIANTGPLIPAASSPASSDRSSDSARHAARPPTGSGSASRSSKAIANAHDATVTARARSRWRPRNRRGVPRARLKGTEPHALPSSTPSHLPRRGGRLSLLAAGCGGGLLRRLPPRLKPGPDARLLPLHAHPRGAELPRP